MSYAYELVLRVTCASVNKDSFPLALIIKSYYGNFVFEREGVKNALNLRQK